MISNFWTRKGVVLVAAIVTFTCVAALLSVNLASPDPISSAALGADWQCSRIAFVLTTCTPPVHNVGAGPPTAYDLSTSPAGCRLAAPATLTPITMLSVVGQKICGGNFEESC